MIITRFLLALSTAITAFVVTTPLNNFYLIIPLFIVLITAVIDNDFRKPMSKGKIGDIAVAGFVGMSAIWVVAALQPEVWVIAVVAVGIGVATWVVVAKLQEGGKSLRRG